jgi:hypothetical protein
MKNYAIAPQNTWHLSLVLIFLICLPQDFFAQTDERFKGQPPIALVSTVAKPVQKQWKGEFTFDEGSLRFNNDFDGARLNGVIQTNDSTYTALITSENTPVNMSPWYAFKVSSSKKRTIHLMLTYQKEGKHRYIPKLSTDGVRWKMIDSRQYVVHKEETEKLGLTAQLILDLNTEPLWVSSQELETTGRVHTWAMGLAKEKFITKSVIGRSREGRDMELLTIGKPQSKRMLMVISRQHPPEVTGYLAMQAFIETIGGDSRLAKRFRRKYTTYVVPLMNPDGVDNGHWRHNAGAADLNRDWGQFNHPETRAVRDFMVSREKKTKGTFYFGIDFHSTWDDIYYTLNEQHQGNMPGLVPAWLENIKKDLEGYDPFIRGNDPKEATAVSRDYFFKAHGAESLVFEIGDTTERSFIKEKGKVSAEHLMRMMLERMD